MVGLSGSYWALVWQCSPCNATDTSLECLHYGIMNILPILSQSQPWTSQEVVQKHNIHITHNLTRGMLYSSMLLHVNLDSLAAHREDLSRCLFRDIMDPASCLHSLLPPPRSIAITSRLRSSQILPKVYTCTKHYCSFIQYGLNHY